MTNETFSVFDIKGVRQDAKKSFNHGAITESYPLDVKHACKLLNDALASEILCVLRYRHHQVISKGINFPQVASQFEEHAEAEEIHMMMIAERIVIEVYRKMISWFSADTTTRRMLEEILADEEEHATDMADLMSSVGSYNKEASNQ